MQLSEIERGTPCRIESLATLEERLGRQLPPEFKSFVVEFGDAFVGGEVRQEPSDDTGVDILGFMDLNGLADDTSKLRVESEYIEVGRLPFASSTLGGWYILEKDNSITFRIVYLGNVTLEKAADSFSDLLGKIVIDDEE